MRSNGLIGKSGAPVEPQYAGEYKEPKTKLGKFLERKMMESSTPKSDKAAKTSARATKTKNEKMKYSIIYTATIGELSSGDSCDMTIGGLGENKAYRQFENEELPEDNSLLGYFAHDIGRLITNEKIKHDDPVNCQRDAIINSTEITARLIYGTPTEYEEVAKKKLSKNAAVKIYSKVPDYYFPVWSVRISSSRKEQDDDLFRLLTDDGVVAKCKEKVFDRNIASNRFEQLDDSIRQMVDSGDETAMNALSELGVTDIYVELVALAGKGDCVVDESRYRLDISEYA